MKSAGRTGHLAPDDLRRLARSPEASAGEQRHLDACAECRDELRLMSTLVQSGAFASPVGPCPEPERLVELVDGMVAGRALLDMEDHLTACMDCSVEVENLRRADARVGAAPALRIPREPLAARVLEALRSLAVLEPPLALAPSFRGGAAPSRRTSTRGEKGTADDSFRRGADSLRSGKYEEAREALDAAVRSHPTRAEYRYVLAQVLLVLGEVDGALAHLDRCAASRGSLREPARRQAEQVRELLGQG